MSSLTVKDWAHAVGIPLGVFGFFAFLFLTWHHQDEARARYVAAVTSGSLPLERARTTGGQTYLPIELEGAPSRHGETVANIVERFRAAHPELRIVRWRVKGSRYHTYGLWITHEQNARAQFNVANPP